MAVVTGNESLLALSFVGDLTANKLYFYGDCYEELISDYNRKLANSSAKETDYL